MDQIVLPPDSYVEALTAYVMVIGDRDFGKVIKVKWSDKGMALIQWDWCP